MERAHRECLTHHKVVMVVVDSALPGYTTVSGTKNRAASRGPVPGEEVKPAPLGTTHHPASLLSAWRL